MQETYSNYKIFSRAYDRSWSKPFETEYDSVVSARSAAEAAGIWANAHGLEYDGARGDTRKPIYIAGIEDARSETEKPIYILRPKGARFEFELYCVRLDEMTRFLFEMIADEESLAANGATEFCRAQTALFATYPAPDADYEYPDVAEPRILPKKYGEMPENILSEKQRQLALDAFKRAYALMTVQDDFSPELSQLAKLDAWDYDDIDNGINETNYFGAQRFNAAVCCAHYAVPNGEFWARMTIGFDKDTREQI